MELIEAQIKNFRSIKDVTIPFTPRCRILVGINESGKSNILKALALLDDEATCSKDDIREPARDEQPDEISYVRFIFRLSANNCNAAIQSITENTLSKNPKSILIEDGSSKYTLSEFIQKHNQFLYINRIKDGKKYYSIWQLPTNYKIADCWKKPKNKSQLQIKVSESTAPVKISSFKLIKADDFPEIPSEELSPFTKDDLTTLQNNTYFTIAAPFKPPVVFWKYSEANLLPSQISLQSFIENPDICLPLKHMFNLSGFKAPETALKEAMERSNGMRNLLERISEITTKHFRSVWKDLSGISVQLHQQGEHIEACIKDTINTYDFSRRSDGFKRFFSFLLTVSVKAKTHNLVNTVYLHDEPEVSLHPAGSQYLRDELIKISKENYVVYSTHSIFMIDKQNIGRHLLIKKENEVTSASTVNNSNITDEEVIYNALGWSVFEHLKEHNIIFEGWRDLQLFRIACSKIPLKIRPALKPLLDYGNCFAKGVKDIQHISSILELANRKYLIISDADNPAKERQKSYLGTGKWYRYDELETSAITSEDFYSKQFIEEALSKLLKESGANHESCIGILDTVQSNYLNQISSWLITKKINDPKSIIDRLKDRLIIEMTTDHISESYYQCLNSLIRKSNRQ